MSRSEPARRKRDKRYREANVARIQAYQKQKYLSDKDRRKDVRLRAMYGISLEQFEVLLAAQGNVCAICKRATPGGNGGFHVDHDHTSNAVRGLLCSDCNRGLGLFRDRADVLAQAVKYLTQVSTKQLPFLSLVATAG